MLIEFRNCLDKYLLLWQSETAASQLLTPRLTMMQWAKQVLRYIRLRRSLGRICRKFEARPELSASEQQDIMRLVSCWLQIDAVRMDAHIKRGYVRCTEQFIRMVRDRWPEMDQASIFQALRNIWIMNVIQLMADQPVELTGAMFAYSMLYPLSDNWLDNQEISAEEKHSFSLRFGRRLRGETLVADNKHEQDIFSMIDLIEGQYSRSDHPEVYKSLLLIHQAQCDSLKQQRCALTTSELVRLTFSKGAASVIADGYLVLGHLSASEIDFLTGYGIVLQLADDLQDMYEDSRQNHHTLFTSAASPAKRWRYVQAMLLLSETLLHKLFCRNAWLEDQIRTLLGQSMRLLIGDAIYAQQSYFTRGQLKSINSQHPVGLHRHVLLRKMLENELPVFQRYYSQTAENHSAN